MKPMLLRILTLLVLLPLPALAATYTFNTSGGTVVSGSPSICSGAWSRSGATFTCNGPLTTAANDVLTVSTATNIEVVAQAVSLTATTAGAGDRAINLRASSNQFSAGNSVVNGTVTANTGSISLSGGRVSGLVLSGCCTVTTNGTDLLGGARSNSSGISITGGTIQGDFFAANNSATFTGVDMLSGSVSGASTVTFTNSTVGRPSVYVTVNSVSGAITLNNTTAYGSFTAPGYSTVNVNNASSVTGSCLPNSTPGNACQAGPLLSWSLDELNWSGAAGEVLDASGNDLPGTVFNGAVTANTTPALPTVNAQGTCRYGSFNTASSQYVQRAHSGLLTLQDNFSIGIWVRPRTLPASGLMSILSKDENYEFHLNPNGTVNWWWQTTGPSATREFNSTTALTPGQWSHVLIRHAPGDQRIYINGNLAGQASFTGTPLANTDPLQLGADQSTAGRYFNGELDELRIYNSALSPAAISALVAERHPCELALQCFSDDFGRAGLGEDWAVASRGSTAFTPVINGGRMRLTSNQGNVATSSTLQRLFPAAGNFIQVQFRHYAYNGSGADGVAVVLSDATITPQPGAFGGPLGYGTKGTAATTGFAGGWLGVGIDEYGNFSTEGGPGGPGRLIDSVAVRGSGSGTTGYRYIAGTPANLSPGIDNAGSNTPAPGYLYRITVDGRFTGAARLTVERDSGAGFVVLPNLDSINVLTAAGQASLPEDLYLSLTGSTGGSTNIHELDDLQVCAINIKPIAEQVDHFDFTYTSPGLTCSPQQVIVRACMNSDCSQLYSDPVSLTLAPAIGWTVQAPASLSNGNLLSFSGGSAVLQLRGNTVGARTLGVSASQPTAKPNSQTTCSTANCQINFADSGFLFDVPNLLANKELANIELRAVRKDISTQRCVPAFETGTRRIQFWSGYSDPVTGTQPVQVNGTDVAGSAPGTGIDLAFGPGAQATMRVRYTDAGLMTLNARYAPATGEEAGLVMTGTDQFVSKPYGLLLQTDGVCSSADIDCPVFPGGVRAGDPFQLRIAAVAWQDNGEALTAAALADNLVTPNFRLGNIGLSSAVVAPAGADDGSFSPSAYSHVLGDRTDVAAVVSEVGIFRLSATPQASYFGEVVSGGSSELTGRFIPAYLRAVGRASLTPSCGSFSYQGQPMSFAPNREPVLTISGRNRQDGVTRNYDQGAFWRLLNPPASGVYSSTLGNALDTRLQVLDSASVSVAGAGNGDGLREYRYSGERLSYVPAEAPEAIDLPFMARLNQRFSAASLSDADGACHGGGTGCTDFAYDFTDEPGSEVRLGRLHIGNAHGSELQALSLPVNVQSWQNTAGGNAFMREGLDNCSAAQLGAVTLTDHSGNLAVGDTTASLSGPLAGVGVLNLTAPGAGNDGSVRASFLSALPPTWLYYDWQGNGREMARGLATFGIYQGSPPLIFRRELYR
jgi:MSHA biogenesis protein MshQ